MARRTKALNQHDAAQPEISQVMPNATHGMTMLQEHFLGRLQHFLNQKADIDENQGTEVFALKALDRAIYSTYLDCIDQGVGKEAKTILRGVGEPAKA